MSGMMTKEERAFRLALGCFCHTHPLWDHSPDQRMNCEACCLLGYEPRGGWDDGYTVSHDGPYVSGWAITYINALMPIPEKWKAALAKQRARTDNPAYVAALEEAIAKVGYRMGGKTYHE